MAVDKLVDSTQLDADLTSVANAIRTKGGTSASLAVPAGFVSAIGDISGGGVTGYGDPYAMMMHGFGAYTVDDVSDVIAWDTYANNTNNSRRCIVATAGEHQIKRRTGASTYVDGSGLYPIEIPSGASKLSLSQSGSGQVIVFFGAYSTEWVKVSDTGWMNFPISNYTIPSGATHIFITLRVNSSNSNFAATNTPKYVNITFS